VSEVYTMEGVRAAKPLARRSREHTGEKRADGLPLLAGYRP